MKAHNKAIMQEEYNKKSNDARKVSYAAKAA